MTVAAPNQVNLQVRIAEVGRNVDRQLGIRWGALGVNSSGGDALRLRRRQRRAGRLRRSASATRGSRLNIDVVLQALSEEGLVTIMAEPNLTARSGEPASFLAGGEYPYSVVNDDENTIEFKDFGIGLNFTPTVLDGNRISLKVATEVSELDFARTAPQPVPSLKTRRAETTVDLGQRPELRDRRADAEHLVAELARRCRGSARCRCSARCSARTTSSAGRPSSSSS